MELHHEILIGIITILVPIGLFALMLTTSIKIEEAAIVCIILANVLGYIEGMTIGLCSFTE
jgi:hypothetical protein